MKTPLAPAPASSRRSRLLCAALFLFPCLPGIVHAAPADLDSAFVSAVGLGLTPEGYPDGTKTGAVNASAMQSTGKILAGGNLSRFNDAGAFNVLKRLNGDGSPDLTWNSGGAGFSDTQGDPEVNALLVTTGDKVYVGGVFTHYNGTVRQGILRLNADGSLDTSFNVSGISSASAFGARYVLNIKEQTVGGVTKILLIGAFDRVNGVSRKNLARLNADGTLDTTFVAPVVAAAGAGWDVEVLPDGKLLASVGSYVPARERNEASVFRLNADGAHDPSFNLVLGDEHSLINDILPLPDGSVLCGGSLAAPGSSDLRGALCFNANGSPNTAFNNNLGTGPNGWCGGELYLGPDGMILACGVFTSWNGTPRASVARLTQAGVLDPVFNPQPYLPTTTVGYFTHLYTCQVQLDGKIVVGGWMKHITDPGIVTHSITRFTGDYTAGPGTLRLTAPAYVTAENAGTYLIGVSRAAGTAGAASVTWTLAGGTAVNGTDYTAGTGTLNWAANEGGIRYITVPILQDAALDGDKAFFVTLSGAVGATLATPDNAPVLIRDDDGPPVILVQPVAVTLDQGNNFAVVCFFDSVLAATIQWQFNNGSGWNDIPGATSVAYGISGANPALHAGQYRAVITNANASVTSNAVTVTIRIPAGSVVPTYVPSLNVALSATMLDATGRLVGFGGNAGVRISDVGVVDATFAPAVTGAVSGLLPAAGDRMLIAGSFTAVNGAARNYLARLNADGTLDATFTLVPPTDVTVLAAGTGGKFYIGLRGSNGVRRYNADGTQDNAWNGSSIGSGNVGYIYAIRELSDGRVLVAHITGNQGAFSYKIELFSSTGAVQSSFVSPAMNWNIAAIEPLPDGRIAVAGRFSSIGGVAQQRVAILKMDGSVDTSFDFDAGADGPVTGLRFLNGRLLIWGDFSGIAGTPLRGLARVNMNGILDSTFRIGGGANNSVTSLQVAADGDLLIAGAFTSFNGVPRNRVARLEAGPGAVSADPFTLAVLENAGTATVTVKRYGPFTGAATVDYTTVADSADAPGDFTATSGTLTWAAGDMSDRTLPITIINSASGEPVESFRLFLQNATPLDDMTVAMANATITITDDDNPPAITQHPASQTVAQGSNVTFTVTATGIPAPTYQWTRDNVDLANGAGISGATTATLTITGVGPANAAAYRCRVTNANGSTTSNPAQLAIALVPSFADAAWPTNLVVNSTIFAIAPAPDGGAYVGGAFTNFNNTAGRSYLVKINAAGVLDTNFSPAPDTTVRQIILDGSRLYVRGQFTTIGGGSAANGFAVLDAATGARDGAFMTNLGTGATGGTATVALFPDGDVLLGGSWTSYNGSVQHARAARLNPDGTLHSPWDLSLATGAVSMADVGPDGKAVLSGTISVGGGSRFIRLNPDSTRDASFAPAGLTASTTANRIRVLADGRVMACGASLPPSNRTITRLAVDGSWANAEFSGTTSGTMNDFAFQTNGRTMAGGSFAFVRQPAGSGNVNNITRFDTAGAYEGTWASGTGADNTVYAVALADNGNVWLGGDFVNYNGTPVQRLARLNGDIIPLAITLQPRPQTVNPGTTAVFTARATGTSALAYEWRRNGTPLTNGGDISGADTAVLSIANAEVADEDQYSLRVTNLFGEVISQNAELVVLGAPEILAQPATAITTLASRPFTLAVTARGIAPLTYQWRKNTNPLSDGAGITGTATAQLSFANLTLADAGTYDVIVTGTSAVTSQPIVLTVLPHPLDRSPAFASLGTTLSGAFPGLVRTILPLPDGGALAGGSFNSLRGADLSSSGPRLARINANGSVTASTGVPAVAGDVYAIARQRNGKIIIGGAFTAVGGQTRQRIARLNADLSLDTAFDPGTGPLASTAPVILAVAVDDLGRVYAAGDFDTWGGLAGTGWLVRLRDDGSFDPSFRISLNNQVQTLALDHDGRLLIGGSFTNFSGASRIARLLPDGTRDASFAAAANFGVTDLAVQPDGAVVAAVSTEGVRRFLPDGTADPAFTNSNRTGLNTVAVQPNGLILGGGTLSGGVVRLTATGAADPVWTIGAMNGGNSTVEEVRADGYGRIWAVGSFTSFNGIASNSIAVLNGDHVALGFVEQPQDVEVTLSQTTTLRAVATGSGTVSYQWRRNGVPLANDGRILGADTATLTIGGTTANDPGDYTVVISNATGSQESRSAQIILLNVPEVLIAPAGDTLEVGAAAEFYVKARGAGTLSYEWLYNGQPLANAGTVSGATAQRLRISPLVLADGGPYSVRVTNAAGSVTTTPVVLTVNRNPAAPDNAIVLPVFNTTVSAILPNDDGTFFAGGLFTTITYPGGSGTRNRFAKIRADGTPDTAWPTFGNGQVTAIARDSVGRIYVGGSFTSMTPSGGAAATRNRLVRLNSNGALDTTFDAAAGPSGPVYGIKFDSTGRIYIYGDFGNYRGEATSGYAARLNDNGTRDATFVSSANTRIYDLEFAAGNKLWLAHANSWAGQLRIALVDELGVRDPAFAYTGNVSSRGVGLLADGSVLSFSNASPFIQKISTTGTVTTPFPADGNGSANGAIATHATYGTQFYVNGAFTTWGGTAANTLARINADGTRDATFDAGSGFNGNTLDALVVDSAGRVWCAGGFNSYRGDTAAAKLVVLNGGAFESNSGQPADPFADFLETAGVPAGQRGANDDPDYDGIHNLMEYALDLNPMANSAGLLPEAVNNGTHLTLTYRRLRNDVTYTVEASSDLAPPWSTALVDQGTPGGDGTTTASIPLTAPRNFLRLRVTLVP